MRTLEPGHYIQAGRFEGRTISFDGLEYIASYNDLIAAFGPNADAGSAHFIHAGFAEGRVESFDPAQYLANYADLQAAFDSNFEAATIHFITNGYTEGRTGTNRWFDGRAALRLGKTTEGCERHGTGDDLGRFHRGRVFRMRGLRRRRTGQLGHRHGQVLGGRTSELEQSSIRPDESRGADLAAVRFQPDISSCCRAAGATWRVEVQKDWLACITEWVNSSTVPEGATRDGLPRRSRKIPINASHEAMS